MMGLLFLFFMAIWGGIVLLLLRQFASKLPKVWWRPPALVVIFGAIFLAPLADDIAGGLQFSALCKANSGIEADWKKVSGGTVYATANEFVRVDGTFVPVQVMEVRFVNAGSGKTVVKYRILRAYGGWLTHWLALSEGRVPLTFDGSCRIGWGDKIKALFQERNIAVIDEPLPEKR